MEAENYTLGSWLMTEEISSCCLEVSKAHLSGREEAEAEPVWGGLKFPKETNDIPLILSRIMSARERKTGWWTIVGRGSRRGFQLTEVPMEEQDHIEQKKPEKIASIKNWISAYKANFWQQNSF